MGFFTKIRCPVCGWQISPGVLRREIGDERVTGMLFYSTGDKGIRAVSPLKSPEELESNLRDDEKGSFHRLVERFLRAIENWCNWGWLNRGEVLQIFGIYPVGGGILLERFEKFGERPKERVTFEHDFTTGKSRELERKEIPLVIKREVKTYEL